MPEVAAFDAPRPGVMKLIVRQATPRGTVLIGQTIDGLYHVFFGEQRLASSRALSAALKSARDDLSLQALDGDSRTAGFDDSAIPSEWFSRR